MTDTKSHGKQTWAAKHANMLLGIGGTIGAGLMAWLFNTVNNIENELIYMNTKQEPIYAELLHYQDEVAHLRVRVLAQEQAMRILGYPVPEVITDDAAVERKRAAELERKLKEAEEEANKPIWDGIFGKKKEPEVETTVDQSDDYELPQEAVTIPTPKVDEDRIKRYMEQVQQQQQQQYKK